MSVCPICQSENLPNARSCHYCGASLLERRHRAPNRPAPALNTRPQLHHDPLADLDIATIPRTLPPTVVATQSNLSFEADLSEPSLGGGALTIDEESFDMGPDVGRGEIDDFGLDESHQVNEMSPRRLGGAELTIDEAADGLALLAPSSTSPEFSFAEDEPVMTTRLKLSDLGGDELSTRPKLYDNEPGFGDPSSLSRQREGLSEDLNQDGTLDTERGLSAWMRGVSATFALSLCVATLWGLDLIPTLSTGEQPERPINASSEVKKTLQNPARAVILKLEDQVAEGESTESDIAEPPAPVAGTLQPPKPRTPAQDKPSKRSRSPKAKSKSTIKRQPSRGAQGFSSLISAGEKHLMQGKVRAAQALFRRAQELKPTSPIPTAQLGWCELSRRRYKTATQYFKRALRKSAGHGDSLYGLGYSYEKQGDAVNARRYFEDYIKRYPRGAKVKIIERKLSRL